MYSKVSQDYQKVKKIIDSENTPFMDYVAQIFEKKKHYSINALQICYLKCMLLVPQADATLESVIKLYDSLPYNQKEKFKKLIVGE